MKNTLQRLTTNLWFDKEAEEAAYYYTSIFKNSRIIQTAYYGDAGYEQHRMKKGTVMTVEFTLDGCPFVALNGGPIFKFNESVSFIVNCKDQQEVDYYWDKLREGGDPKSQQCGWLKDKYGVSWQIVPEMMAQLAGTSDSAASERAMTAMMKMKKLDIEELQKAFDGR